MITSRSRVQQFLCQSVVPIICSVLIGFIFYQSHVFNRHYGAFQFVWSSVVASVFYYLLGYLRTRDAFLGLLLLFFLTLLTTESTRFAFILRDIFYVGAIGISIVTYFKYFRDKRRDNRAYPPFVLAGIYAVVYMIASEIHLAIIQTFAMENTGGDVVSLASTSAFYGVLVGFAVGAGIAVNEELSRVQTNSK